MPDSWPDTHDAPKASVMCSGNSSRPHEFVKLVQLQGREFQIRLTPDHAEKLGQDLISSARRARTEEPPQLPPGVTISGW